MKLWPKNLILKKNHWGEFRIAVTFQQEGQEVEILEQAPDRFCQVSIVQEGNVGICKKF